CSVNVAPTYSIKALCPYTHSSPTSPSIKPFFWQLAIAHRDLLSFPTRRSSDLKRASAQQVGHIVDHLLVPPGPVVADVVAPQVHPDGDALLLKELLHPPGGGGLLPVALAAADHRFLGEVVLHKWVVGGEVVIIVHLR